MHQPSGEWYALTAATSTEMHSKRKALCATKQKGNGRLHAQQTGNGEGGCGTAIPMYKCIGVTSPHNQCARRHVQHHTMVWRKNDLSLHSIDKYNHTHIKTHSFNIYHRKSAKHLRPAWCPAIDSHACLIHCRLLNTPLNICLPHRFFS